MSRLRVIHNLRIGIFVLVVTLALGALCALIWANSIGMPRSWRQAVENAISKHGLHVEIGGLSYHPFEGIVARQITVFSDAERKKVVSRLEGLILDIDHAKLAKGELQISKVKLTKARLLLAIDANDPDSEPLEITDIEGEFTPPGNSNIEIRNARGTIAGIRLVINASIKDDATPDSIPYSPTNQHSQRKLVSSLVKELKQWTFDADHPPELRVEIVGRRSAMHLARASIDFQACSMEKNQHSMERLELEAELHQNFLSINSLTVCNGEKNLQVQLNYNFNEHKGRFDLKSSLEIPELLRSWLGMNPIDRLTIAGNQTISASGQFVMKPGVSPDIRATGHVICESAHLSGINFDQIQTSFAWRNGDMYLKDLMLSRHDGMVEGKAMIEGNLVRMKLRSTLLPDQYRPLFLGTPVEKIIDQFAVHAGSSMELKLEGGFDRTDLRSWAYAGMVTVENVKYRGVGLTKMQSSVSLSSDLMDFTDGSIVFDYSDYPMAIRFKGPDQGSLRFDSVRYLRGQNRTLNIDGLEGSFWPAPLCRLFLNKTSDHLEKYKFHEPPKIHIKGMVDLEANQSTLLDIRFSSAHLAEYDFLGAPVQISNPSGNVIVTDEGTRIQNMKLMAFDGDIHANLSFPRDRAMTGQIKASTLSMDTINSTYGLKLECGGSFSGNTNFSMMPSEVDTMTGDGSFSLVKSELFSVPIFGPLSHLMQVVLNDKRIGAQRAKTASANFIIKDGVVVTNNFNTATTSLNFIGEGWIDLHQKTMDMTMRMNARGLAKIITMPFRPFYGLFQFRGTGAIQEPNWERVAFTKPNEKVQQMLLEKP